MVQSIMYAKGFLNSGLGLATAKHTRAVSGRARIRIMKGLQLLVRVK